MKISELEKSIAWNVFGVPLVTTAMCAVVSSVTAFTLHSVFGSVTRLNAEASVFAFTLFGLVSGIYVGWRDAYKLWRDRRVPPTAE